MLIRLITGYLFRRFLRKLQSNYTANSGPSSTPKATDKMVQCHHCQVYLPMNEAMKKGEHYFCSEAHLKEK